MSRILKLIFKGVILFCLIAFLAYGAVCVYGNFIKGPDTVPGQTELPKTKEASYALVVKNTGTIILTNSYEQFGDEVGERTYVLHGYWEMVGNDFLYRDRDIILQEAVFGEISLKKR